LQPYNEKIDVFSFGICLFELWTGKEPNRGFKDPKDYAEMVAKHQYRPASDLPVPDFWIQVSTTLQLIGGILIDVLFFITLS